MKKWELHRQLSRPDVANLVKDGLVVRADFVAIVQGDNRGFILILTFIDGARHEKGVMYKQDGTPRVFVTPEALMMNAHKLGINQYFVDATFWEAQHYRTYDAQVRSHRRRRQHAPEK